MSKRGGGRSREKGGGGCNCDICLPKKALYLLIVGQQFAELCKLLCSVTIPSTLPDILNYLLSRPAEKMTAITLVMGLLVYEQESSHSPMT